MVQPNARSLAPLLRALLDPLGEGVLVFAPDGELIHANRAAEASVAALEQNGQVTRAILPRLSRLGARITPLWVNGTKVGEAVYLPSPIGADDRPTLAEQERESILAMLESTNWRLTESARRLGISRTTLWRRLRGYGLERDSQGRWSKPSSS